MNICPAAMKGITDVCTCIVLDKCSYEGDDTDVVLEICSYEWEDTDVVMKICR